MQDWNSGQFEFRRILVLDQFGHVVNGLTDYDIAKLMLEAHFADKEERIMVAWQKDTARVMRSIERWNK